MHKLYYYIFVFYIFYMNLKPIHIDHAPKLIKWKNKATFIEFIHRFYSPSLFVVAFLSAFDLIHSAYSYSIILLVVIAFLSSIIISYSSWVRWKKDFIYLAERETPIPWKTSAIIIIAECILQFLVSIISFWWVSRVPACINEWTGIGRSNQRYAWTILLICTFIFHIVVWKKSSKEMDKCLRQTYDHLDSSV